VSTEPVGPVGEEWQGFVELVEVVLLAFVGVGVAFLANLVVSRAGLLSWMGCRTMMVLASFSMVSR